MAPTIKVPSTDVQVKVGQTFDPISGVTATATDGTDLTSSVKCTFQDADGNAVDAIDTSKEGTYTVTYTVTDANGTIGTATVKVSVKAEQQEGLEPYYSVFNYDRGSAILGTLVAFAALMCAVGGTKRAPCAAQGALGAHDAGRDQRDFTRSTTYWATNRPNSTTCEMR
ncbi:MAG: DUF5011 domain-containing protein [Coriobacteriales bacterium]|nr:DUF5011 domain-containing protein [Coriobacteriales bacterium]